MSSPSRIPRPCGIYKGKSAEEGNIHASEIILQEPDDIRYPERVCWDIDTTEDGSAKHLSRPQAKLRYGRLSEPIHDIIGRKHNSMNTTPTSEMQVRRIERQNHADNHLITPSHAIGSKENIPDTSSVYEYLSDDTLDIQQQQRLPKRTERAHSTRQTSQKLRVLNRLASGLHTGCLSALSNQSEITWPLIDQISGSPESSRQTSICRPSSSASNLIVRKISGQTILPPVRKSSLRSSKHSPVEETNRARELAPSRELQLNSLRVSVFQEDQTVDSMDKRTIFTAIDIENLIEEAPLKSSHTRTIDAMMIIDNSIYSSPEALLSHCKTVLTLVSLLDRQDRISLICTNAAQNQGLADVVLPLSKLMGRDIRSVLDRINVFVDTPVPNYLEKTISLAREELHSSSQNSSSVNTVETTGQIFVMSSNGNALSSKVPRDSSIQTHIICAAPVPWRQASYLKNYGWSIYGKKSDFSGQESSSDTLYNKFKINLCKLVQYAHAGIQVGPQTDVQVYLNGGPHSEIRSVLGDTSYERILPGQTRTLFAKIDLSQDSVVGYSPTLSHFPLGITTPSGQIDVEQELSALLESQEIPVLEAWLRYNHSALPRNTTCQTRQEVTATVSFEFGTQEPQLSAGTLNTSSGEGGKEVQRRFIYHLATTQHPRVALWKLASQFPPSRCHKDLTKYLALVIHELKYQIRIIERLGLDDNKTFTKMLHKNPSFEERSVCKLKPAENAGVINSRSSEENVASNRKSVLVNKSPCATEENGRALKQRTKVGLRNSVPGQRFEWLPEKSMETGSIGQAGAYRSGSSPIRAIRALRVNNENETPIR